MNRPNSLVSSAFAPFTAILLAGALHAQEATPAQPPTKPASASNLPVLITGATILQAGQAPIEDGVLVVGGGKITALGARGKVTLPESSTTIDATGHFITPGLIDAHALVGIAPDDLNEQGEEVTPALNVLDAVDPDHPRFKEMRDSGTTTVHVSPGNRAVIGGLGAVVQTGGSLADMVLNPEVGLRMAMGQEPSRGNRAIRGGNVDSIYYRRPTTRMGVVWSVREAFFKAQKYAERTIDPDKPSPPSPGMEVLVRALQGELMVFTTARAEQDIRTAIRLAKEFGYKIVLDEAVDTHLALDEIEGADVAVLFSAPSVIDDSRDGATPKLHTLTQLDERGIDFAIQTGTSGRALPLVREATFAVRNGLSVDKALAAITTVPAKLLGVDDQVGTLEMGKQADFVVWTAHPFSPIAKAASVWIAGKRVDSGADSAANQ